MQAGLLTLSTIQIVSSEKHQKALLGGVERLCGVAYPDLIAAVPKILMAYYQEDVLEEEVATAWGTHVSKKYTDKDTSKKVRKAAAPFLTVRPLVVYVLSYLISPKLTLSSFIVARRGRR